MHCSLANCLRLDLLSPSTKVDWLQSRHLFVNFLLDWTSRKYFVWSLGKESALCRLLCMALCWVSPAFLACVYWKRLGLSILRVKGACESSTGLWLVQLYWRLCSFSCPSAHGWVTICEGLSREIEGILCQIQTYFRVQSYGYPWLLVVA